MLNPCLKYWRGTAKRLIRINWINIGGLQTIHRFGHQSGRGERSGGLSAAKLHDFSARVFLDRSQTSKNNKNTKNKARHSKYRSGHPKLIFRSLLKDIFLEVRDEKWSSGSDLFGQIGYGAYLHDKIKIFFENRIFPDFRDFWAVGCELVFWQCLASTGM